jgi:demethylmenaquinone methyltransferase / 2-methoxy-6-polyprenyl-1,4-benzoquinol methylase
MRQWAPRASTSTALAVGITKHVTIKYIAFGAVKIMAQTHFGFKTVDENEKAKQVRGVFDSVASKYDVMNDLMSAGLHRGWKAYTVLVSGAAAGSRVLDVAGGTGDLALAFAKKVGDAGQVVHTDINEAMLRVGRDRLVDAGYAVPTLVCDAEKLPLPSDYFDVVTVAFGLRNMTHKELALAEMARVLKPGGKLLVLEFSKVAKPLEKAYDWYSFNILPKLGSWVAGDAKSYQYLAESIRMHPDQETLKAMMMAQGFGHVDVHNMTGGVVALHVGVKC